MCAGGIIGLGEGPKDRVGLIHQLATLPEHPESVPINSLVAVAGELPRCCCSVPAAAAAAAAAADTDGQHPRTALLGYLVIAYLDT